MGELDNIIKYESVDEKVSFEVNLKDETVWLTQKQMGELFECSIDNISLHLKNVFKESELLEKSVVEDFSITASDNKKYKTKHYSLDAILSVGYRVKSIRATHFRQWATQILKDYMLKGYATNTKRLIEKKLEL